MDKKYYKCDECGEVFIKPEKYHVEGENYDLDVDDIVVVEHVDYWYRGCPYCKSEEYYVISEEQYYEEEK